LSHSVSVINVVNMWNAVRKLTAPATFLTTSLSRGTHNVSFLNIDTLKLIDVKVCFSLLNVFFVV
jgi:hypothetical protein